MGTGSHPCGLTLGDARTGLVSHRKNRPDRRLIQLSPLYAHRQFHPPFRRLVAFRNSILRRLGIYDVRRLQPVCSHALEGGLLTSGSLHHDLQTSFGAIGTARKRLQADREQEWFPWCLGSVLFGTIVASFGINYIVQLQLYFFCLLAFVSIATRQAKLAMVRVERIRRLWCPSDRLSVPSSLIF